MQSFKQTFKQLLLLFQRVNISLVMSTIHKIHFAKMYNKFYKKICRAFTFTRTRQVKASNNNNLYYYVLFYIQLLK